MGSCWVSLKGGRRRKNTVVSRSAVALDADYASESFVADSAASLGCGVAFYTTWRHTPGEPRWRLLAPLSRDVDPSEYRLIAQALMVELGYEQFDDGSAQPERFMFFPSTQGDYEHFVCPGDPLDADEWLARAKELGIEDEPEREAFIDDSPVRPSSRGVHPYAQSAIASELAQLDSVTLPWEAGDGWDQLTFDVACNLIEFANSNWSGYTLADAKGDLFQHAPTDEEWGRREHIAKWLSARNKVGDGGRRNPGGEPEDDFSPVVDEDDEPDEVQRLFPKLDLHSVLDPNRPPREWFWEDVIPRGDHVSIIAPGGTGKSLFTLSLTMEALRGTRWFIGRQITFSGKVLYVDMENSEDDWAERLRDLGWDQKSIATVADRFIPLSLPPLRGLDTEKGAQQLLGDRQGVRHRCGGPPPCSTPRSESRRARSPPPTRCGRSTPSRRGGSRLPASRWSARTTPAGTPDASGAPRPSGTTSATHC